MARGKLTLLLAVAAMFCFTETAAYDDYETYLVCKECEGCYEPVNYFLVAVYRIFLVLNVGREIAFVYAPLILHFVVFLAERLCGVSGGYVYVIYKGMISLIKWCSVHPVFRTYMEKQKKIVTDCLGTIGWRLE